MALIYYIGEVSQFSPSVVFQERQLEETPYVLAVGCEAVVDARRQDDEIILLDTDTHPLVLDAADIEEAVSVQDVADLLVLVQVLLEKGLHFLLIDGAHLLRGDDDLIAVLVAAFLRKGIDLSNVGATTVEDTKRGQVGFVHGAARVMRFALVALADKIWSAVFIKSPRKLK